MTRSLLALTAVFAVSIAAPAGAKEIAKVKVCGPSGCHETSDKHKLAGISDGGTNAGPPKRASSFYKITLSVRAGEARDHFTIAYLPAQKLVKGEGPDASAAWTSVDGDTAALYAGLIGDLRPFPASQLGAINPPPAAQVDSVVTPPAPIPPVVDDGDSFPWWVVMLGGAGVLSLAVATGARRRRRTRRAASSPTPTTAS